MSKTPTERGQLDLFHALPGEFAPRDAQDLMAYPFFSLAKSRRIRPIEFASGNVEIRVEAMPVHGMATIWDADILIWAASQIVEARDAGLRTSRLMAATPYQTYGIVPSGTGPSCYQEPKGGLTSLKGGRNRALNLESNSCSAWYAGENPNLAHSRRPETGRGTNTPELPTGRTGETKP